MAAEGSELRIGLTISGAIALGAYEGGALAALLAATQAINEREQGVLRIDAIAGASAGSITGLLTTRTLLEGLDPIDVMYEAWVVQPDLKRLRGKKPNEPLSVDAVGEGAAQLLGADPAERPKRAQTSGVKLHMALACLRGLNYRIERLGTAAPLDATTYLDWGTIDFDPGDPREKYLSPEGYDRPGEAQGSAPVEIALASGAHAAAFPPRKLLRERQEDAYRHAGITNFPDSDWLWYTDGGTIDNEPLGRTLDLIAELDGSDPYSNRLLLIITPDPKAPISESSSAWAEPDAPPEWVRTATRAAQILIAQSLYDDLRRVEKTNSRIEWTTELQATLGELLHDVPDAREHLIATIASIERQKHQELKLEMSAAEPREDESIDELLGRAFDVATGVSKKRPIAVESVSPLLLLADGEPPKRVDDLLAGEFLGHFGGLLDRRLRHSDFALGYESMIRWMEHPARGLAHFHVPPQHVAEAVAAARRAVVDRFGDASGPPLGTIGFRQLPWSARLRLYLLIGRMLRIVRRELT